MPYYRGEVVSDDYLQALLLAYRQAYINAGGPDYEDSDQLLFDKFAASGIVDTSGAAGLGRIDAAADKAAGQEFHTQSLAPGGLVPVTPPKNIPPIINMATSGGDARAFLTLDGLPTTSGNAAPNPTAAGLFSAGSGVGSGSGGGLLSGGGIAGIPWLLIIGVGAAAWYLMKGGK